MISRFGKKDERKGSKFDEDNISRSPGLWQFSLDLQPWRIRQEEACLRFPEVWSNGDLQPSPGYQPAGQEGKDLSSHAEKQRRWSFVCSETQNTISLKVKGKAGARVLLSRHVGSTYKPVDSDSKLSFPNKQLYLFLCHPERNIKLPSQSGMAGFQSFQNDTTATARTWSSLVCNLAKCFSNSSFKFLWFNFGAKYSIACKQTCRMHTLVIFQSMKILYEQKRDKMVPWWCVLSQLDLCPWNLAQHSEISCHSLSSSAGAQRTSPSAKIVFVWKIPLRLNADWIRCVLTLGHCPIIVLFAESYLLEQFDACCAISGWEQLDNTRNNFLLVIVRVQQFAQLQMSWHRTGHYNVANSQWEGALLLAPAGTTCTQRREMHENTGLFLFVHEMFDWLCTCWKQY